MLPRRLPGPGGEMVALVCEITGGRPGPRYVLDACLDTARSATRQRGRTRRRPGRSPAGGCMAAVRAIPRPGRRSSRVAARLVPVSGQLAGSLVLMFDVDEHTGRFGGARAYFEGLARPAAQMA
jgi:succinyl-diaminopimelate desuccinylase